VIQAIALGKVAVNLTMCEQTVDFNGNDQRYSLSFIIPTFNRADVLIECLRHLELQTFLDFEVILVDDGSADAEVRNIERRLLDSPLEIRLFRQKNSGPAKARNYGVSQARSAICIMIGDDILVSPDFAISHLRFHQDHPELHYAGLGLTRWSETAQTVTPLMRWLDATGVQFGYDDLLVGKEPTWNYFYTSNLSLKTETLCSNPFDESFTRAMMEDIELGYRLTVRLGLKIGFVPDAYAEHVHPTDFRKTCHRAYGIGREALLFEQKWPDQKKKTSPGWPKRIIRDILCRNAWFFLSPLTWITEKVTEVWCPNPLLKPILDYYGALGRRMQPLP
jgi:glycosyltransferase involved in cell wall biosynthesis